MQTHVSRFITNKLQEIKQAGRTTVLPIGYYSVQFHFSVLSCLVTNEISQTRSTADRCPQSSKGPLLPSLYYCSQILYHLLPLPGPPSLS